MYYQKVCHTRRLERQPLFQLRARLRNANPTTPEYVNLRNEIQEIVRQHTEDVTIAKNEWLNTNELCSVEIQLQNIRSINMYEIRTFGRGVDQELDMFVTQVVQEGTLIPLR